MTNKISILFLSLFFFLSVTQHGFAEKGHDHEGHGHSRESAKSASHEDGKNHAHKEDEDHDKHEDEKESGHNEDSHDDHEESSLKLDQESREMIGLEIAKVQKKTLGDRLKIYGKIAKDTEQYFHITFDKGGNVDSVKVKLGDVVDSGDPILSVKKQDGTVEEILAPGHGTVISIYAKPGDKIDRLKSLVSLVNLDTLRATVDIYEKDLRFVKVGQPIEAKSIAYPEKTFYGEVVFISPEIDDNSKSIKVRVNIDNSEHLLKLGMSISGELIYHSDKEILIVPSSAVQMLNDENVVFIPHEKDEVEVREVELGHTFDNEVEVKTGLKEGDSVITQGSFYLKSELAKEAFGDGHAH